MSITCDESDARTILRIEGDFDVSSSAEMKRELIEAISSRKELQLDVTSVTDIDVTFIQLLWAAVREAEKEKITCTFVGQTPENIHCIIRESGFENFLVSAGPQTTSADSAPPQTGTPDDRQI